ncbi:uncharacterized protein [Lolium perenne]|uniref:uncharacterized protein isoform X1 n=1 Tax=Lolium perenne TaxID=4522 RepID=UPI0021F66DF8|nr:uncharacterized protein LOC127346269 isoform X1 [Lolium perenne]
MPKGHVDLNFMWLCKVAIMRDWASKSKLILNQPIIEFMKPYHRCDHNSMAKRLKKYELHLIEQLFLHICDNNHWILLLVNLAQQAVEIYDSLRTIKKGEHPYKDLWKTVGTNLQDSYNVAMMSKIPIFDDFKPIYPKMHTQTNNDDGGFSIIGLLECHNGKELVGNGKISMSVYRTKVCDTLVHHRLNDLNPDRTELVSSSAVF